MSHRDITEADLLGKTITKVECEAVNILRLGFSDGTALAIEVDAFGHGIYGMVACDECVWPEDQVVVQEDGAVESAHAHEELEDHAGCALHPST